MARSRCFGVVNFAKTWWLESLPVLTTNSTHGNEIVCIYWVYTVYPLWKVHRWFWEYYFIILVDTLISQWVIHGLVLGYLGFRNRSPKMKGIGMLRGIPIRIPNHQLTISWPTNRENVRDENQRDGTSSLFSFGWWFFTNPFETYAQVKLDHLPKKGWKIKKCLKPPPIYDKCFS